MSSPSTVPPSSAPAAPSVTAPAPDAAARTSRGFPGWVHVAVGLQLLVMMAFSGGYGYQRDELYFRMAPPAWGYVDQPPFTPWLTRTLTGLVDELWILRLAAALCLAGATYVHVLIAREFGASRRAETLTAFAYAFALVPVALGHNLLTATVDLPLWGLTGLFLIRAVRRHPRWWLAVGAVVGLTTFNRWLIVAFIAAMLIGLAVAGPRRHFREPYAWAAAGLALLLATPNIWWQATNGWPQLGMGVALGESNNHEVRWVMWGLLPIIVGPVLAPVWIAGTVSILRRPVWRDLRFLVVGLAALLVAMVPIAGQAYYPVGIVSILLAAGCVVVTQWATSTFRRRVVAAVLVLNAATTAVFALPVMPLEINPAREVNPLALDSYGWPEYVDQVGRVWEGLPDDLQHQTALVAGHYGEAGALDRYGEAYGLPPVYGRHNGLAWFGPPPQDTTAVLAMGVELDELTPHFETCAVMDRMDHGKDLKNVAQGNPIVVCTDRTRPWASIWPDLIQYG